MTWRRALSYVALWVALSAYSLASRPAPPAPPAAPADTPPASSPLAKGMRAAEVVAIDVETPAAQVTLARTGERWTVRHPVGALVQSGLVEALLAALLETPEIGTIGAEGTRRAEFGLDEPELRIRLRREAGEPLVIDVGSRNPTGTAVYARAEGNPQIVLLGLNAQYYADLLVQATRNVDG